MYKQYYKSRKKLYSRSALQKIIDNKLYRAYDPKFPRCTRFFQTIAQAYRILMTRAIKGIYIYVADDETRQHLQSLLA